MAHTIINRGALLRGNARVKGARSRAVNAFLALNAKETAAVVFILAVRAIVQLRDVDEKLHVRPVSCRDVGDNLLCKCASLLLGLARTSVVRNDKPRAIFTSLCKLFQSNNAYVDLVPRCSPLFLNTVFYLH